MASKFSELKKKILKFMIFYSLNYWALFLYGWLLFSKKSQKWL